MMGILIFILLLLISFFSLKYWSEKIDLTRKTLYSAWAVKVLFSFAFIFVFTFYYGNGTIQGDAFNFMNDSQIIASYAQENPWAYFKLLVGFPPNEVEFTTSILRNTNIWSYGDNGDFMNDNRLMIRVNSLIHFISFGNIYVHALVMTFISFNGFLLLFKSLSPYVKAKKIFFWGLIYIPSIGFWTSGITKESLLIFGLGLYLFAFLKLFKTRNYTTMILLLIGILILLLNKPYVGLVIISLSILLLIGKRFSWHKRYLYIFPTLVIMASIGLTFAPQKINLLEKISYKQNDLINIGKGGIFFVTDSSFCTFNYTDLDNFQLFERESYDLIQVKKAVGGTYKLFGESRFIPFEIEPSDALYGVYLIQTPSASYIETTPINYSRKTLLLSIPEVLTNVFLRPFYSDPGNQTKYFSSLNNLLLIGLFIFSLFRRRKLALKEKYLFLFFVISALTVALLIGWTTPILGAIARYKIAAELFIFIAIFIYFDPLKKDAS